MKKAKEKELLLLVPRRTEKKRGFWAFFSLFEGLREFTAFVNPSYTGHLRYKKSQSSDWLNSYW